MKLMNREELAWAAGLFDGEGSVGVYNRGDKGNTWHSLKYRRLMLSIAQADRQVLDRFQKAIFGLGHINGPRTLNSPFKAKSQWFFTTGSFEHVQAIIAALWVFLSPVKKEQAKQALIDYANYRAEWQGRKLPSN